MNNFFTMFACVIALAFLPSTGHAEKVNTLELEDVLQSSIMHFPQIHAALNDVESARGALLGARGPFDLTLNSTVSSRFRGFYSGDYFDTEVTKRFTDYNAEVAVGYRRSDGDFPIYQDYFFTNDGGEASLRVAFSLLRDRDINADVFKIFENEIGLNQSLLDAVITKVAVQRQAFASYMVWLSTGQRLKIYQELLDIALERQSALEKRAKAGDVPEITLTENKQFIFQRQTNLRRAKRDFENATNTLSLFFRDNEGQMITPTISQLPKKFPALKDELYTDIDAEISRILAINPEIRQIENEMRRARNQIRLGENSIKPRLDVELYNGEDFGSGSNSREGFESSAKVNLSFNLQQRLGEGQIQKGEANFKRLEFKKQQMAEQTRTSLLNIVNDINAADDIVDLTVQEISATKKMEKAERKRFDNGQSDFFLVNIRELNAADARIKFIDARRDYLEALGNYIVATLDFESLGIRTEAP